MAPYRVTVCALVLIALCAGAAARARRDVDAAAPTTEKITNEINQETSSEPAPPAARKKTEDEKQDIDQKSSCEPTTLSTPKTEDTKEDEPKPNCMEKSVQKTIEKYPHAVLFGWTCGGTIISPTWILTAGHCTVFMAGGEVLAGTDNSKNGGVIRKVKRYILHPLFSVGPYWVDANDFDIKQVAANWDFMLVELKEALPLDGKTMAAVALDDKPGTPVLGLQVTYGGFGAKYHGDSMRTDMHGMELQVLPDVNCQKKLEQYEPECMLCAQGIPPRFDSACNGDSGSGLVANGTLYGVTSWVEEDSIRCFNGALVVFARVSSVRDWIRQVTKI